MAVVLTLVTNKNKYTTKNNNKTQWILLHITKTLTQLSKDTHITKHRNTQPPKLSTQCDQVLRTSNSQFRCSPQIWPHVSREWKTFTW